MKHASTQTDPVTPAACQPETGAPEKETVSEIIDLSGDCPGCGNVIREKVKFCQACGHYLGEIFFKQPTQTPIRISTKIRDRFYAQESVGVIELQVQNRTGKTISKIEIAIESDFVDIPAAKPAARADIADGDEMAFRLNLIPRAGGELLTRIFLTYWITEDQPNVLEGETVLYVRKPEPGHGPITIDRSVHIDGKETYGVDTSGAVSINITNSGGAREPLVPLHFKEGTWRDLPLKWDQESTKVLRDSLMPPITEVSGPTTEKDFVGAWLRLQLPDGPARRVYLHFKPEIQIGKGFGQDIICAMMADDGNPDEKIDCISRSHVTLRTDTDACWITDHSSNGTFLDSHKLHNETLKITNSQILNLAGVFPLKYNEFRDLSPMQANFRQALLSAGGQGKSAIRFSGIRKELEQLPINAVRLRKIGAGKDDVEYFIILKELDIGSARTNALVIPCDDISELHARLVVRNQRLHLVDLGAVEGAWVNDEKLHPYEGRVVGNGDVLRLGRVAGTIRLVAERSGRDGS